MEYRIKWLGDPRPKWEPIENLAHCKDSLDGFEIKRGRSIIGVKKVGFDFSYALLCIDETVEMIPSCDAKKKWPNLLQDFFVDRVRFPLNSRFDVANGDIESKNLIFLDANPPKRIIGIFHFYLHSLFQNN